MPADGIFPSSIVTAIARNGYEVGIRISGLPGRWFYDPLHRLLRRCSFRDTPKKTRAPTWATARFLRSLAWAPLPWESLPPLFLFSGCRERRMPSSPTEEMYEICHGEHDRYRSAFNGERGLPLGIDVMSVVELQRRPKINTAVASREAGVGMIGAGVSEVPLETICRCAYSPG